MCDKHYDSCKHSIKGYYGIRYCGEKDKDMTKGIRCEVQRHEDDEKKMKEGMKMEENAREEFIKKNANNQ